jgi:hypothetical protein
MNLKNSRPTGKKPPPNRRYAMSPRIDTPRLRPVELCRRQLIRGQWGQRTGSTSIDTVLRAWRVQSECTRVALGSRRKILLVAAETAAIFLPYAVDLDEVVKGWYAPSSLALATLTGLAVAGLPDISTGDPTRDRITLPSAQDDVVVGVGSHQMMISFAVEPRFGPRWQLVGVATGKSSWGWQTGAGPVVMGSVDGQLRRELLRRIITPKDGTARERPPYVLPEVTKASKHGDVCESV